MKNLFLTLLVVLSLLSCNNDDNEEPQQEEVETTIVGRWHLVGFEDTVMYQFTETQRHTIYAADGNFGGLETAIPSPNNWTYEDEKIVIDLNFGNFLIVTPNYSCDGNVVNLVSDDGSSSTLFRENFDYSTCN